MAKLVFLLISLAVIQTSLALKCKRCVNECEKLEDETCSTPTNNQEVACLTEKYKDKSDKLMTDKKCVLYPKNIPKFSCVSTPGTQPVSCDTCTTDFCNSGYSVTATSVAVFGVILSIIVPRLM